MVSFLFEIRLEKKLLSNNSLFFEAYSKSMGLIFNECSNFEEFNILNSLIFHLKMNY